MLRHICVAHGGDERSERALALGAALARECSARLTVVHVAPPGDELLGPGSQPVVALPGDDALRREGLLRGLTSAVVPDIDTEVIVATGPVSAQLLGAVHQLRPDLVVAGHHRRRSLLLDGPVRALLTAGPCPVLLVPLTGRRGPTVNGVTRRLHRPPPLLWQLFAANALVLFLATLTLIVAPVSVSSQPVLREALVMLGGLVAMLAFDLALLRRALGPLHLLTDLMRTIDPHRPGLRLPEDREGAAEVVALAEAFNAMLGRLEDERRTSSRRALAAQEDERLRIAREMHDQVGQGLTAATFQIERAVQMAPAVERELLEQIGTTVLQTLDDVRRIGRDLRPEALDDLGLGNALIALCRRMASHGGVRIVPELRSLAPLRPEVELVIYRIAQEAITNAVRHAGATRIDVRLATDEGSLDLLVRDDGRGLAGAVPEDTAGISGMRERARLVEGELVVRSASGWGTEVGLTAPLEGVRA